MVDNSRRLFMLSKQRALIRRASEGNPQVDVLEIVQSREFAAEVSRSYHLYVSPAPSTRGRLTV